MKNFMLFPARAGSLGFFLLLIHILPAQSVQLVKDIWPGSNSSIPVTEFLFSRTSEGLARADTFFFTADDGVHGIELWRSDGTEAGTWMVSDINPGSAESRPTWLTLLNNGIVFFARHDAVGLELWYSDGTQTGTYLIKDINPGPGDAIRPNDAPEIRDMVVLDGVLYFAADSADVYGQLWRTDGTTEGTYALKTVCPACTATSGTTGWLTGLNNNVYIIGGKDLWKSDGTAAGTIKLVDGSGSNGNPGNFSHLRAAGDRLYFAGRAGGPGNSEPYFNDGSSSSATLLKEIVASTSSGSFPRGFTAFDGKVYFIANQYLWVTGGTSATTVQFSTAFAGNGGPITNEPSNILVANNRLFFNALGSAPFQEYLFATDGTAGNTTSIASTNAYGFAEIGLVQADEKVCFWGLHQNGGLAIWLTDGTNAISHFVTNLLNVQNLWVVGDYVYFFAEKSLDTGRELYRLPISPVVTFSVNLVQENSIECNGAATASLLVQATGGVQPYTYSWNHVGVSGNNPSNLSVGQYKVTVTDAGQNRISKQLYVSQPPSIAVNQTVTPAGFGQSNGSITLTASGTVPPYSYTWASGDTTGTLNNLATGTYVATITDGAGCSRIVQVFLQQLSGVADIDKAEQWSVFPVPGRDWLQIGWQHNPISDAQLELLDQCGTVVRHWDSIPQERLDVSDVPSGIYVLRMQNQQYTGYHRVVLMN